MKKYSSSIASSSSSSSSTSRRNNNKTTPCCSKVGMKRGPWTAEEDELLSTYIKREGEGRWRTLPKRAGLHRCGKSCRLRWMNYLRPNVKRGHISSDEEDLILRLHRLLGNKWSLIAGRIPGRTDNEIKNYWNTHLSKKLISQGIDPRTHKPFLGNNSSSSAKVVPNDHINSSNPNLGNDHDQNGNAINFNGDLMNNDQKEDYINDVDDDDVFSSFLNSLMNEEMFNTQNQQQQEEPAVNLVVDHHDILISSSQTFVFGPGYMGY